MFAPQSSVLWHNLNFNSSMQDVMQKGGTMHIHIYTYTYVFYIKHKTWNFKERYPKRGKFKVVVSLGSFVEKQANLFSLVLFCTSCTKSQKFDLVRFCSLRGSLGWNNGSNTCRKKNLCTTGHYLNAWIAA